MFQALREKLRSFKKKVKDDILEEDVPGDSVKGKKEGAAKKGKFKKRKKAGKGADTGDSELLDGYEGGWAGKKIGEKKMDDVLWELELALMESDVAVPVVEEIKNFLKKELIGKKISRKYDIDVVIESALKKAIMNVLSIDTINFDAFVKSHSKPVVLMFVGINGTGKTTSIAKIAYRLKQYGYSSVIAASDTFRAGAIEQLERHSAKLGVKLIKHQKGSDPAAIAYDSIEHAKARKKEVVLIDTAGRMQTNVNLMDEMKKLKRIAKPDMIIFVGDSLSGNDAVEQAIQFNNTVEIDTAILTKIDADAKGGAALSIAHAVGKPIIFVGTGQKYSDLDEFNPNWMVERLFE
ncbi:MAG: signal recognition particle-docking protein FtsY [Thermoplasmata archaeon]|nr:MAG: signal recognition particle-docking protein FtsY [Thermoplasmata archaeon]